MVVAVVLFGDTYFNRQDKAADRGSYSGRRGGLFGQRPVFGGPALVLSYCHSHDPICQGVGERIGPFPVVDPGSLTFRQHTNYAAHGEPQQAAALVASKLPARSQPQPKPTLSFDPSPFQATACGGSQVADLTFTDSNSVDTLNLDNPDDGPFWAYDSGTSHLTLYLRDDESYCGIELYTGAFRALGGLSPGGTGTIAAGRSGTITAGRTFTFTGDWDPTIETTGDLGSQDDECSVSDDRQSYSCDNTREWKGLLFDDWSDSTRLYDEWLYVLSSGHGSWLQTSNGNQGDITG